jgi:branched-chain amino acid aminotransferase
MAEKDVLPEDLFTADEIFFTGTAAEVIPVTKIDERPIGGGKPGAVTAALIQAFKEFIREERRNAK